MRIAVTGATGHLGANLVRLLVEQGHMVTALYYQPEGLVALDGLNVARRQADVLDIATLVTAFAGAEVVIHLAAIISISGDPDGSVMRTNVEGTRNVASACLLQGVGKLIHASSIHAFNVRKSDQIVDESHAPADASCFRYDYSKALGEQEILAAVSRGLDATILNPTGIIGPCDFGLSHSGIMLRKIFAGKMPVLVRGGFDWVDARDVACAAHNAIERGRMGERYILSGHWVSFSELAALCDRVLNKSVRRWTTPIGVAKLCLPFARLFDHLTSGQSLFTAESLHIIEYACDAYSRTKAERELGFKARPLEETLSDTYGWFRTRGDF